MAGFFPAPLLTESSMIVTVVLGVMVICLESTLSPLVAVTVITSSVRPAVRVLVSAFQLNLCSG